MWDDPGRLRLASNFLFGISTALLLYAAAHYVVHLEILPLKAIHVTGDVAHVTREQVEAVVTRELRGNFFTIDLAQARAAFEKLPWVRKVSVRREWPDRLEFLVEEHKPLARWGSTALVSHQGEVFEAAINMTLPVLHGPQGTALEVATRFQQFEQALSPLGKHISHISLSQRRAWVLKLDDGMVIELGRDDVDERLAQFVHAYEFTVSRLPRRSTYVDLRYTNGFAVRSTGFTWNKKKI